MPPEQDKNCVGIAGVDYLMYSGYITLAEHWLRMEAVAALKLADPKCSAGDKAAHSGSFMGGFNCKCVLLVLFSAVLYCAVACRGQTVL